jgi:hypothetical protein
VGSSPTTGTTVYLGFLIVSDVRIRALFVFNARLIVSTDTDGRVGSLTAD